MPRRRSTVSTDSINIEHHFILFRYILSLLGFSSFMELKNFIQSHILDVTPTFETTNQTPTYYATTLCKKLSDTPLSLYSISITEDDIFRYDSNILNYLKKINQKRQIPINLKYYQYLAILFTEIYFDLLKNKPDEFINSLNNFANSTFTFDRKTMNKLAYFMATGSGKTIIAHINYHQFHHYKLFEPDCILFITPNEGLSKQHHEELINSNHPAILYSESGLTNTDKVLIIEITKFTEVKKGSGLSITPDSFEGRKLIFVDEGHKGQSSEERKWKSYRDQLAENGFVFEYSATFAQILNPSEAPDIFEEYCKSIIFDYSYKYFYYDGYGKDFSIINIQNPREIQADLFTDIMFVGNLLTFYEQLLIFENNKSLAVKYNLEKPLWIFVGSTVTASSQKEFSDILTVVILLSKFVSEPNWALNLIEIILNAKTGLRNPFGEDIFENSFLLLPAIYHSTNREEFYHNLLKTVFNGPGPLRLFEIKNAEGEIALKTGDNSYFALINIGNVAEFKKLLTKSNFTIESDIISPSLFDSIKSKSSTINILIGSKKFIEGWDTWRVSSIGLLYVGKSQGPQIIQLFGRGVRLLGENNSLKRSNNPQIKPLETLKIYGIKSDYLVKFLEAIKKEEIELEPISVPIKPQHEDKWNDLKIIKLETPKFYHDEFIDISKNSSVSVTLNLLPRTTVGISTSTRDTITIETMSNTPEYDDYLLDLSPYINLFNWQRIYTELLSYKLEHNYWNINFTIDSLKNILSKGAKSSSDNNFCYKLYVLPEVKNLTTYSDIIRLEDIAILLLKKYISALYKIQVKEYESKNATVKNLTDINPLSIFESTLNAYIQTVYVKKETNLLSYLNRIHNIVNDTNVLLTNSPYDPTLPRIIFHESLFLPLLLYTRDLTHIEYMNPTGLNEGERDFLLKLIDYLENPSIDLSNYEIYVLRNYPRSGIGFLIQTSEKFYPDFIIWIKPKSSIYPQAIVFADPKSGYFLSEEKINLALSIKDIEKTINSQGYHITLESFIIIVDNSSSPIPDKNLINLNQINLIFEKVIPKLNKIDSQP